jgi:RNA polymerase sigma-70 factor (ECF subfamily)
VITNSKTDESLFVEWQKGNMKSFELLYARYRQTLYLFLLRGGLNEMVAEDLFHDCWMKVMSEAKRFDGNNFKAWVFTLARNIRIDHFRKTMIRDADIYDNQETSADALSAEVNSAAKDCVDLLKVSIAQLPNDQRDVFLLKEEAGLSLQEIANLMAVGKETIKSRIRYAMKQLRHLMVDCL